MMIEGAMNYRYEWILQIFDCKNDAFVSFCRYMSKLL
jgi:hypothetical protein